VELGTAQRVSGQLEASLETLTEAVAAARHTNDVELQIAATREFGLTLLANSRLSEAESALKRVLDEVALHFGEDSLQWASAAEELALARRARGDLRGALELQRGAYRASARSLGRTDPITLALGQNAKVADHSRWPLLLLVNFHELESGPPWSRELPDLFLRTSLSEPKWMGAKKGYFKILSEVLHETQEDEPGAGTFFVQSVLGRALTSLPGYELTDEGFELAHRVFTERTSTLGLDHPQTLNSLILLARATSPRDVEQAIELGWVGARRSEQVLGRGHIDTLGAYEHLAELLDERGDREEAVHLRTENLALRAADEGIIGDAQPPIENLAGTLTEPLIRPEVTVQRGGFAAADMDDVVVAGGIGTSIEEEVAENAPETVGDSLVRRTAHVELDPSHAIQPGDHFDVGVYVDSSAPGEPGTGELVLEPPPGDTELTLRVWLVVSRHFEIEGDAIRPLPIDLREPSSPKLIFRVRAANAEEHADDEPEVRVFFSYLGWPSGEVRLPVPLVQPASERAA
jgi:tetratricopeptide (TPR) repeat protein